MKEIPQHYLGKCGVFILFHSLLIFLQRVVIQRVLPQLCAEFSNHQMIPFVLPNVLLIAEDCTTQEFIDLILPELKPVFKIQDPVQVVIIFLQKMDILLAKTPKDDVRDHVLPMVCKALETPAEQLQVPTMFYGFYSAQNGSCML